MVWRACEGAVFTGFTWAAGSSSRAIFSDPPCGSRILAFGAFSSLLLPPSFSPSCQPLDQGDGSTNNPTPIPPAEVHRPQWRFPLPYYPLVLRAVERVREKVGERGAWDAVEARKRVVMSEQDLWERMLYALPSEWRVRMGEWVGSIQRGGWGTGRRVNPHIPPFFVCSYLQKLADWLSGIGCSSFPERPIEENTSTWATQLLRPSRSPSSLHNLQQPTRAPAHQTTSLAIPTTAFTASFRPFPPTSAPITSQSPLRLPFLLLLLPLPIPHKPHIRSHHSKQQLHHLTGQQVICLLGCKQIA